MEQDFIDLQSAFQMLIDLIQQGNVEMLADFAANKLQAGRAFNEGVVNYALKLYEHTMVRPQGATLH